MTADSDVFYGFVFEGQNHPPERVEEATRAMQPHLDSGELRHVNGALLARLAEAKAAREGKTKKELLDDPAISTLVNTLVLANKAWITTVIARNIKSRPHLRGASTDELYSTALTGYGHVGGVMNAILEYDYEACGVAAFSHYLTRAVNNALQQTSKQAKTYQRVGARTHALRDPGEDGMGWDWVDRTLPPPEAAAINHDLLEVVQSVIPRLPNPQQRATAAWMMERILTTGELPMAREAAAIQRPRVSRERGRQIMEATMDSIRRQIEADYPQLAEQGINGWEEFVRRFKATVIPAKRGRS